MLTVGLTAKQWMWAILGAVLVMVVDEIRKAVEARRGLGADASVGSSSAVGTAKVGGGPNRRNRMIEEMAIVGNRRWEQHLASLASPFSAKESQYFADVDAAWEWVRG